MFSNFFSAAISEASTKISDCDEVINFFTPTNDDINPPQVSKSQGRVYLCCCKDIYIEMEEVFQIKIIDGAETLRL